MRSRWPDIDQVLFFCVVMDRDGEIVLAMHNGFSLAVEIASSRVANHSTGFRS